MCSQVVYSRFKQILLLSALLLLAACGQSETTPTPTQAAANIAAATATPRPSATVTIMPTGTSTPQPTATPTATPLPTNTPTPTITLTPLPTDIPTQIENGGAVMLLVRGGFFKMGSDGRDLLEECRLYRRGCQQSWFVASEPARTILLHPFYIDAYEVTNQAYVEFLNELGEHEGACFDENCLELEDSRVELTADGRYIISGGIANYPVRGVSWYGAAAFCEWRGASLPTEAQWEMAASWDPESQTKTNYPWGDTFDPTALNFCDEQCPEEQADKDAKDGFIFEAPVGSYPAGRSPIGAYDMAGNLWEWVNDWFAPDYYQQSPTVNPRGPATGEARVVRGGSWFDTGNFTAAAIRFPAPPAETGSSIGFRCALDH